jgi:hypothetical protein
VYEITVRCNGYPGAVKLTTSDCNTFCFTLSREGRKLCRAAADGLITLSILTAERRADTGGNGMELANPPHIINMPFVSKGVIQGVFLQALFFPSVAPVCKNRPISRALWNSSISLIGAAEKRKLRRPKQSSGKIRRDPAMRRAMDRRHPGIDEQLRVERKRKGDS